MYSADIYDYISLTFCVKFKKKDIYINKNIF